jgi:hypothetical protein
MFFSFENIKNYSSHKYITNNNTICCFFLLIRLICLKRESFALNRINEFVMLILSNKITI